MTLVLLTSALVLTFRVRESVIPYLAFPLAVESV
jgi:hypothetical protein